MATEWDEAAEDEDIGIENIRGDHVFIAGTVINQLSQADPGDIQKIAASQIELLTSYYNTSLAQAKASFHWALVAAGTGLAFILGAIALSATSQPQITSIVTTIGGVVAESVASINFWLYGKTLKQLNHFHETLDKLQRFLLANSICESLDPDTQKVARYNLVATIANFPLKQPEGGSNGSRNS